MCDVYLYSKSLEFVLKSYHNNCNGTNKNCEDLKQGWPIQNELYWYQYKGGQLVLNCKAIAMYCWSERKRPVPNTANVVVPDRPAPTIHK